MSRSSASVMRRAGIFAAVCAKLPPWSLNPPPTITKYLRAAPDPAHASLEPDRRDVVLAAPVRTSTDLDARSVCRRDEIRPRPQVILEQTSEPSRLSDGQAARFGTRATGHIGNRRRF